MNDNQFLPKSEKEPDQDRLRFVEGDKIHRNPSIGFDSTSREITIMFNQAIEAFCKQEKIMCFHQVSPEDPNEVGEHEWELWSKDQEEKIKNFIEEINGGLLEQDK